MNKPKTVGAILMIDGKFPFMFRHNNRTKNFKIVRLGGHIEANENILDALKREIYEEAKIDIEVLDAPVQYFKDTWESRLQRLYTYDIEGKRPVLIKGTESYNASVLFLCRAEKRPVPDHETLGILMLSPREVRVICQRPITVRKFISLGGELITENRIESNRYLEAGPHLKFLNEILRRNSRIMQSLLRGEGGYNRRTFFIRNRKIALSVFGNEDHLLNYENWKDKTTQENNNFIPPWSNYNEYRYYYNNPKRKPRFRCAIVDHVNNIRVGNIQISPITTDPYLTVVIYEEYRNMRYGIESLRLMLRYLKDHLKYDHIKARIMSNDELSMTMVEKLGFKETGFRRTIITKEDGNDLAEIEYMYNFDK